MNPPLFQRLYLRIWLAVVMTIVLLAVFAGWLSQREMEQDRAARPAREIVLRNEAGEIVGQALARPVVVPGQGPEFQVTTRDGQTLLIQFPRRREPDSGAGRPGARRADHRPLSFPWMLALVAFAVAVGTYPVVRRLTKRLEALDRGVRQWGAGDLSLRVAQSGQDEVAHLAKGFNAAAERVQALLLANKALLANASHELRSPLTRIRMGLELMGERPGAAFKDEIARNIQELDQLIDEILLASRLDASEADIGTLEPVELLGLAAEECARLNAELQAGADAHGLVVRGVAKLLRRVLRNLLENAHRHAAGTVTLGLSGSAGMVEIVVCDHGPGVPAEARERIFEPFYRLPGASERDGGVGLGLALVKSIVQRHGGTVQCDNRASGGACFTVRLPQCI